MIIGVIEHFGYRNHGVIFDFVHRVVQDNGTFLVQDWENYGPYYAPRLAARQEHLESSWDRIAALDVRKPFDERFRRMFNYYFLSCKAGFETDHIHLWHIVMSKLGRTKTVYPRVNLLLPPQNTSQGM